MRSISSYLSVMVMLALSSTVSAQDEQYSVSINGEAFDLVRRGAVDPDAVWKFDQQATKVIFVCWENPTPAFANEMKLVQRAVEVSWQSMSELRFLGWGNCVESSMGIRILVKDDAADGPRVRDFGRKIDGLKSGMILNFTFKNWMPACQEGTVDTWISRIAVHEFGHAIGFRHEQDRDDTVGEQCKKLKTGPNPQLILTPYDPMSIMNYCWCEGNSNLSKFDTVAVQKLYGKQ
jgi:hypothetical protein